MSPLGLMLYSDLAIRPQVSHLRDCSTSNATGRTVEEIIRCRVDGVSYRINVTAEPEPLTWKAGK